MKLKVGFYFPGGKELEHEVEGDDQYTNHFKYSKAPLIII